jgi:hypothetical protein
MARQMQGHIGVVPEKLKEMYKGINPWDLFRNLSTLATTDIM